MKDKRKQRFYRVAPWIIPVLAILAWHVLTTTEVIPPNVLPQTGKSH
ncbi:hypothetical protein LJK88_16575 [Paenibacillus sp. P26]|nr:hypothetical protein LJK88_16575 [Paenibacillus sp. P26]